MQIFITPKSTEGKDALVISAVNSFILIASFSPVSAEKYRELDGEELVEKAIEPTESEDAESFVALLSEAGASNALLGKAGAQVGGERIGLPDGVWRFDSAQVLDFDNDRYGSGERSARSMWKFSLAQPGLLPVNSYAQTFLTKSPRRTAQRRYPTDAVLYLPFSSSIPTDETATLHILTDNVNLVSFLNVPKNSTIEQLTIAEVSERKTRGSVFPDLSLSAPLKSTSEGIVVVVRCAWADDAKGAIPEGEEVFIETSGGYISKQRAKLINGEATFKFMPTGLDVGEVVTIQAGFRLFSGISSIDVEIV